MKNRNKKGLLVSLLVCLLALPYSCKENIDMENQYTFQEYTITSYLEEHEATYSEYIKLLSEIKVSKRSSSSVLQLLSARGKYTVFAPSNEAIHNYLDSLTRLGLISEPSWDAFPNEQKLDSVRQVIVYNSIIDGTRDNVEPYTTSSFQDEREIDYPNMNDRKLIPYYDQNDKSIIYINGVKDKDGNIQNGAIIDADNRDIYTVNGYIHQVHDVVAPSDETMTDLLKSYIEGNEGDYVVAAKMLLATGLGDSLTKDKDERYEELKVMGDERVNDLPKHPTETEGRLPEHRYYGYTLFAETDDFWRATLGKEPKDISPADVQAWVVSQGFYPNAKVDNDYSNEENALNQFFTYHLLPVKLPANKLVIHYNEKGYNYKTLMSFTVPTYELYTTMGKRRLLKLYQCGKRFSLEGSEGIFINRFPEFNTDRDRDGKDDYSEKSILTGGEGIEVNTEKLISLKNAYIYPIDKPLVYDEQTRENFQKQRLRFDVAGLFPEFMNNNIRANRSVYLCMGFPIDANYKYLDDVDLEEGTNFFYLSGLDRNWNNWQGDELNVVGQYGMTFRLPPVPKAGTYEIRYAVQSNSSYRGMCQVYFGSDKENLPAMGIPLDLRMGGVTRRTSAGNFPSIVGWEADKVNDDEYNAEVDKKMRANGFMKGPKIYAFTPGGSNYARDSENTIRRIIVREYMVPEKTYYLKFKTVLEDKTKQFFMDYIEFCAKEVYDNPNTPEDLW